MNFVWKLVAFVAISSSVSKVSSLELSRNEDIEKVRTKPQSTFNSNAEILSEVKFHCNNRPAGYYADPRFNCEVFHFCHEDGTRVTIPCVQGNEKHKICTFRDIAYNACESSEIYLALPEDLHLKATKDTTASALNGATEFKLPKVLPQPTSPSEKKQSTTPISFNVERLDRARSLLSTGDVGGIYEVFNSVLKEIEARQEEEPIPKVRNPGLSRLRPSTFSRGSRLHSTIDRRVGLIDATSDLERRMDEDGAYLVEVYNKENEGNEDNDYSSYRRKAKKFFFSSNPDKKTPAKHPRRRKRTVVEPLSVSRPYAVIYAKFPGAAGTTSPRISRKASVPRQDPFDLPFAPAIVPSDVPTVPITIETRRKKKGKSRKKPKLQPENAQADSLEGPEILQGQPQPSEQQNVLYYSPERPGIPQLSPDGRTVIDTRYRGRESDRQTQRQRPQPPTAERQQSPQPPNELPNNNNQSPYAPQGANQLQIPNFPFQPPSFLPNPIQAQFDFGSQYMVPNGGFPLFGPQLGLPDQFQAQPQQPQTSAQAQANHQSQPQPNERQPPRPTESSRHPSGENTPSQVQRRPQRPQSDIITQGFSGFENPFLQAFPGFGPVTFNTPYVQADPNAYDLLPANRPQPQEPIQPPQQQYVNPQRPREQIPQDYSNHERIRPQIQSNTAQTASPLGAFVGQPNEEPNQYNREVVRQPERPRPANDNTGPHVLVSITSPTQRPYRTRGRPAVVTEEAPSIRPERPRERARPQPAVQYQTPRRPTEENRSPDRPRERPQRRPSYERRPPSESHYPQTSSSYRPERPTDVPARNRIPSEYVHRTPKPSVASVQDYSPPERPPLPDAQSYPRDIIYSQREPVPPQRNRYEPQSYYDREGGTTQPQYSTYQYPSSTPSPPPRIRTTERYRSRGSYQRPRPATEEVVRNVVEERPSYGQRTTFAPDERIVYTRSRPSSVRQPTPEDVPVTTRYYATPPPRYRPPAENNEPERYQQPRPSRYSPGNQNERPRTRPQVQIERPPSEHVHATPVREEYSRPQGYYPYAPARPSLDEEINVISTIDEPENRPRTPPSEVVRRPYYRGYSSNVRPSNDEVQDGFLPLTERPLQETYHRTVPPPKEYREPNNHRTVPPPKEYREPNNDYQNRRKVQNNRYQNVEEDAPTTREVTTTPKSTPKPRPPPPRPTFPPFPTFPPPPKRLVTSPRPRTTESTEPKNEISESTNFVTDEPKTSIRSTYRSRPQTEIYAVTESSNKRQVVTDVYLQTDAPEVTTKRRSRKRRPRPRRPRPTTPADDDQSVVESMTQATSEREISTRTTSGRFNKWKQQTTPQPRKTTTTASTTEVIGNAVSSKNEEYGSRINLFGRPRTRKPAVYQARTAVTTQSPSLANQESKRVSKLPSRTRKPFTKRISTKTTTTTEQPETTESIARSDEDDEFLHFESEVATSISTALQESESITQLSIETTANNVPSTESYHEAIETTVEYTTPKTSDATDNPESMNKENIENFESTRSVYKKFQNRPRVLKFGKPRLRTTDSPIDLNVEESRYE